MTGLLQTCGQGGIADAAHQEAYDSSFLIADPTQAFVLETAGSDYAAAPFPAGAAISNRITLGAEWTRASASLAAGRDFDRFRDLARTRPMPMSAWRPAAVSSTRPLPAASPRPPPRPTCATTGRDPGVRPAAEVRSTAAAAGRARTSAA